MRFYKSCPTKGPAKKAWTAFMRRHGEAPKMLWKLPNNFVERSVRGADNPFWGCWCATFVSDGSEWKDYYDPSKPEGDKARNVFEFIGRQGLVDKILSKLKGG